MNLQVSKKRLLATALMAALCLLLLAMNLHLFIERNQLNEPALSMVMLLLIGGCYVQSVRVELNSSLVRGLWMMVGLFALPYVMVCVIEYLAGQSAAELSTNLFWLNYFWCQMVYLLLFAVTNHYRFSIVAGSIFCYVVGAVNYFVLQFRSSPLQLTDVMSIGTAADVAGNYVIALDDKLLLSGSVVLFAVCVAGVVEFHHKRRNGVSVLVTLVLLGVMLFSVDQFYEDSTWEKNQLTVNFWNPLQGYQENGTALSLAMTGKYLRPEKPEHYSTARAAEIIETSLQDVTLQGEAQPAMAANRPTDTVEVSIETKAVASSTDNATDAMKAGETPNIIAIMNESYTDLSILGDFETSVPYMSFYQSLKKNTIRGNLAVSVLGGGTCNSEFEFLTGLTTAFLPSGVMAYQQYVDDEMDSMATILKAQGYKALAFHPGKPDSWQRDKVYPNLGFEEFLTEKDMEDPQYMREAYVTDSSDYKEVIRLFEEKGDDKLFLFNVTIQNHGGYQLNTVDIPKWVSLRNVDGRYPETEQYLSIMHASDQALRELITYFETVKEPTMIVFFGDHQPSIESSFVETLMGQSLSKLTMEQVQMRYQVPFFIWANYDIEEEYYDNISANYLSTLTLKTAGVELPAYNQYLDQLQQRLPVINALGYADANGDYHYYSEETAESELIEAYKIVQYNYLFGGKSRLDELYTIEPQTDASEQQTTSEEGDENAA